MSIERNSNKPSKKKREENYHKLMNLNKFPMAGIIKTNISTKNNLAFVVVNKYVLAGSKAVMTLRSLKTVDHGVKLIFSIVNVFSVVPSKKNKY